MVLIALVEMEDIGGAVMIGGAVAAAKLVISRGYKGKGIAGSAAQGGEVVVEGEAVGYGLAGELAALEH